MKYYLVDEADWSIVEGEGSIFHAVYAVCTALKNIVWYGLLLYIKIWFIVQLIKAF